MISSDFNSVMNKIRIHIEESQDNKDKKVYDIDIAKALDISKEHYCRSKKESKIPLQAIINFCAKENIVINYILFDQMPESLNKITDKIISIKYFKNINTSAGGGAINEKENFEYIGLDKDVVEQLGGKEAIKNIEALNVTGESMEPIIKDGSIIFIDKSKTIPSIRNNDVYVVNTRNGVVVKKVTFLSKYNKLRLLSCNPLFLSEVYDCDEVEILGKVVGTSELLFH